MGENIQKKHVFTAFFSGKILLVFYESDFVLICLADISTLVVAAASRFVKNRI